LTAAKKGVVRALTLILGRRLCSSADAGLTEIEPKIEPQTTAQRISDEVLNTPGRSLRVMAAFCFRRIRGGIPSSR
jgi:hypothetical protein